MSIGIRQPFFFRLFNKRYLTCKIPNREQTVFLTFDDGPDPEVTPEVLKILEKISGSVSTDRNSRTFHRESFI
jgi:hypothetical protein